MRLGKIALVEDVNPLKPVPIFWNGRFVCRPETPCPADVKRSCHPQAESLHAGDVYFDHYHCPVCGLRFTVEVPE